MINKTVLQFKLQYPEDRADASEPHGCAPLITIYANWQLY